MYTSYNKIIKRNVYGLYFSGKNQMEGEYRNVSDNYHIAVFLCFTIISFILEKFLLV